MTQREPLDEFHIETTVVFGWLDRLRVLLGKRLRVSTTLPVYKAPKDIGGLQGEAQVTSHVEPLWPRRRRGAYAEQPEPAEGSTPSRRPRLEKER